MSDRITYPRPEDMTAEQAEIFERTVSAGAKVVGREVASKAPRILMLHEPRLTEAWAQLPNAIMATATYPKAYRELVILVVAREWNSDFEWHAHHRLAVEVGVPQSVVDAIRVNRRPVFEDENLETMYDYALQLQTLHRVDDATYAKAWALMGTKGLINITALIGQYTNVAMMINAHNMPLPEGTEGLPPK